MASRVNGDTIVGQIDHHLSTDTDLSDVAHSLVDDHAHRPSMWQQDLQKANQALHDNGMLMDVDIVGMRGQDFITQNADGKTQIVDSTDIADRHDDTNSASSDAIIGGRHASINSDGSGTIEAKAGDNKGWNLAHDILQAQGIDTPSPNQMANFQLELEKLNGKSISHIRPGDTIKVPPTAQGGDETEFTSDRIDRQAKQQDTALEQQVQEAHDALNKLQTRGASWALGDSRSMNEDDIQKALQDPSLSPADREGLTFMDKNYDQIATKQGFWNGGIYNSDLDKYLKSQETQVETWRVAQHQPQFSDS